jgi:hypothetical protein
MGIGSLCQRRRQERQKKLGRFRHWDRYSPLKKVVVILPLLFIDLPDRTSCFQLPIAPHTGGDFQSDPPRYEIIAFVYYSLGFGTWLGIVQGDAVKLTRSDFLKLMAAVAGTAVVPKVWANPWGLPLGIQLYTVRRKACSGSARRPARKSCGPGE